MFIVKDRLNIIGKYIITTTELGKGSSSNVYLGYNKKNSKKVAIKKYKNKLKYKKVIKRAKKEINILKILPKHKNIIDIYNTFTDDIYNNIYLIMEYCSKKSLYNFLGYGKYLDEKNAFLIMIQLRDALKHLHSYNIYHRDLKPHNILLKENFTVKLIDFGLSIRKSKTTNFDSICGTPKYMAPEIILNSKYNIKSDLWSIGLIMYEILFGYHPFDNISNVTELKKYLSNKIPIEIPPKKKPNVKHSPECLNLLSRLLIINKKHRISWKQFFHHPWFDLYKINKIKNIETSNIKLCVKDNECLSNNYSKLHNSLLLSVIHNVNKDKDKYLTLPAPSDSF